MDQRPGVYLCSEGDCGKWATYVFVYSGFPERLREVSRVEAVEEFCAWAGEPGVEACCEGEDEGLGDLVGGDCEMG